MDVFGKRERPKTTGRGGDREPHDRVKGTKTAREENKTKMQEKTFRSFFQKGHYRNETHLDPLKRKEKQTK